MGGATSERCGAEFLLHLEVPESCYVERTLSSMVGGVDTGPEGYEDLHCLKISLLQRTSVYCLLCQPRDYIQQHIRNFGSRPRKMNYVYIVQCMD